MARPRLKIDVAQLEKLAMIGCTTEEMAGFFECSRDTLERRFAAILNKGKQSGKIRLRRIQMQIAERGNAAMAIWLGKIMLGQVDSSNHLASEPHQALTLNYKLDE